MSRRPRAASDGADRPPRVGARWHAGGVDLFTGDLEREGDYELLELDDRDLTGQDAREARFLSCALHHCVLDGVRLGGAHVLETSFVEVRADTLDAPDAEWRDVALTDCRLGALRAFGGDLLRVTVTGGKIDYLNLRGTTIRELRLVGTTVDDLDLAGATARDVVVQGSRVRRIDVTGAHLTEVDLRGADLSHVDGLGGLAGAVVSEEQLAALAPLLAAHLGIVVR